MEKMMHRLKEVVIQYEKKCEVLNATKSALMYKAITKMTNEIYFTAHEGIDEIMSNYTKMRINAINLILSKFKEINETIEDFKKSKYISSLPMQECLGGPLSFIKVFKPLMSSMTVLRKCKLSYLDTYLKDVEDNRKWIRECLQRERLILDNSNIILNNVIMIKKVYGYNSCASTLQNNLDKYDSITRKFSVRIRIVDDMSKCVNLINMAKNRYILNIINLRCCQKLDTEWLAYVSIDAKPPYYFKDIFPVKELANNYYKIYTHKLMCPEITSKNVNRRRLLSVDSSAYKKAMEELHKKSVLTVDHGISEQKVDEALQIKEHGIFGVLFKKIDDFLYKHLG